MKKLIIILLIVVSSVSCRKSAGQEIRLGSQYKIIRPVYLVGAYRDMNNMQVHRAAAFSTLYSTALAQRPWMAFQYEVPAGTTMTIISRRGKAWDFPFIVDRYLVQLAPDLSQGLDVDLNFYGGMEGRDKKNIDGLNSDLFEKIQ